MSNCVSKYFVAGFFVIYVAFSQAEDPAQKGLAIAMEADARDSGWKNFTASMRMELTNSAGQISYRDLDIKSLEVENDGDKSKTVFHSPKDVEGTVFLSFSHALKQDEQWLYLPALKRVKRISSDNKSGPFMGSEFAFEDLSSNEIGKYSYEYLRDETLDGVDCYIVRFFPQYEYSGYKYRDVWIDKLHYRTFKVNFYDKKAEVLKTLIESDFRQYLGKYWRADKFLMVNSQNNKKTLIEWRDYKFSTSISEEEFNVNSLMRGM